MSAAAPKIDLRPPGSTILPLLGLRWGASSVAAPQPGSPRLLASTAVAVQGTAFDGLIDRAHQHPVLAVGDVGVTLGNGAFKASEVGLDRRGVATVLDPLPFSARNPLLL
jgi:hypothetical protein